MVLSVMAVAALTAGCSPGPVNIGTMPISGTWVMGARVAACAPETAPVLVELDFHTIEPSWARVEVDRFLPSEGDVALTSWSNDGRHWEFTTETVDAGDCLNFFINSGCACCDPCPPVTDYGFDYRISQLD